MYSTVDELQQDLDNWLDEYNFKRPYLGYRNHGGRTFDTVKQFIKTGDGFSAASANPLLKDSPTAIDSTETNGDNINLSVYTVTKEA